MYELVIVEDEMSTRQGLACFFPWKELGFEVVGAFSDGDEALSYIKENSCDVVLSDIKMNRMSGLELSAHLRELTPHTKVVILSGYSDFAYAQEAIHNQVTDYLLKPIDDDDLTQVFIKIKQQLDEEAAQSTGFLVSDAEAQEVLRNSFLRNLLSGHVNSENELKAYFKLLGMDPAIENYPLLAFELKLIDRREDRERTNGKEEEQELLTDILRRQFVSQSGEFLYYVSDNRFEKCRIVIIALNDVDMETMKRHWRKKFLSFSSAAYPTGNVLCKMTHAAQRVKDLVSDMSMRSAAEELLSVSKESEELYKKMLLRYKVFIAKIDLQQESFCEFVEGTIRSIMPLPLEQAQFTVKNLYSMILQEYQSRSDEAYRIAEDLLDTESPYEAESCDTLTRQMKARLIKLCDQINEMKKAYGGSVVSNVLQYIENNISNDISGDTIAECFHLHPSYISRMFKQKTGERLSDYMERLRMEKAILLLLSNEYSIQEISLMVGYISPSYFSAKFRKFTGYAPREYYYKVLL